MFEDMFHKKILSDYFCPLHAGTDKLEFDRICAIVSQDMRDMVKKLKPRPFLVTMETLFTI